MRYLSLLLLLCACATPETILQKGDDTVTCGGGTAGSIAGGMIGYTIQKDNDKKCIEGYKTQGYKIIKHSDE